jgi:two-component system KDP operon response regulator KdpE
MQAMLFTQNADDGHILSSVLQLAGFSIHNVHDLDQAIESWFEQPSDFILLSPAGKIEKSIQSLRRMRANTPSPILVIGDPSIEEEIVHLYEAGIDLFIPRPYSLRILLYQIRALLKRSNSMPYFSLPSIQETDIRLDPGTRMVTSEANPPRHLTQLEFRLLYVLMTNAGQIIPYEQIIEQVWGYTGEGNRELVRGLIQRLRSKIEPDPQEPVYILTEPGVGYLFTQSKTKQDHLRAKS